MTATQEESLPESCHDLTPSPYSPKGIKTEDIIALKIRNPNLSITQAAKVLDCGHTNIVDHLKRHGLQWGTLLDTLNTFKDNRADILAYKGKLALENLTDEKMQTQSAVQNATVFAILLDKERLLRGESTQNVAYADMSRDLRELDEEIARLEAEIGKPSE